MGDFFSFGTAILLVASTVSDKLFLAAWTRSASRPEFSIALVPPLRLRLTAGLPQILNGPEKLDLVAFSQQWTQEVTAPLALPIVTDQQVLLGVIVLLDTPPFDLEEENFTQAWYQLKRFCIDALSPVPKDPIVFSADRLKKNFEAGHRLLALKLDLFTLLKRCEDQGLPAVRVQQRVKQSLADLAGKQGAVLSRPPHALVGFFVLSARTDEELLMHQVRSSLVFPEGFEPHWQIQILANSNALDEYLAS